MADSGSTRDLVVDVLREADDPLTPSQISRRVERSLRSVRGALRDLEDEELVTWRLDVNDARRRLYALTNEHSGGRLLGPEEEGRSAKTGGRRGGACRSET